MQQPHPLRLLIILYLCLPNQGHNLITKAQLPRTQSKAQNYFSWWQVKQVFLFAVSTRIYQTGPSSVIPSLPAPAAAPSYSAPRQSTRGFFFSKAKSKLKDKSDVSTLVRYFFHLQSPFSQLIPEQDEPIRRLQQNKSITSLDDALLNELPRHG